MDSDLAWTAGEHLTAHAVDALRAANWQRQGKATAARPKPLPRPSDAAKHDRIQAQARAFRDRRG